MDPFLLSFRDRDLESRYQTYHAERQRGADLRSSLLCTITCAALLCKALEVHPAWSSAAWRWAVVHTLVVAPAPAVWSWAHRQSWARWRRLLLLALVPYHLYFSRFVMSTLVFNPSPPTAPYLLWKAFNYSGIMWQLMLSLYYRLPFAYHLPAHLEGVAALQPHTHSWCRWISAASPGLLATLHSAAQRAARLTSRHLATSKLARGATSLLVLPPTPPAADPELCSCQHWLLWGQLYFGLGLGSYVVWLLERRSRHIFLLQMSAGTASISRPSLAQKVKPAAVIGAMLAAPLMWKVAELVLRVQRSVPVVDEPWALQTCPATP